MVTLICIWKVLVPMGLTARFDPCAVPVSQLAAAFRKRPIDSNWAPNGPWVAQVDAVHHAVSMACKAMV